MPPASFLRAFSEDMPDGNADVGVKSSTGSAATCAGKSDIGRRSAGASSALRPVRILIFHEHLMALEALAAAMRTAGYKVVAATTDSSVVKAKLFEHRPDVCLLAAPQDEIGARMLADALLERGRTRVAVLLAAPLRERASDRPTYRAADAVLAAGTSLQDLVDAVSDLARFAAAGSPGRRALPRPAQLGPAGRPGGTDPLTAREREVLRRLEQGENVREIAAALNIAVTTARTHVASVRAKLGARTQLEAVALAHRRSMARPTHFTA